jgi:hypothetical protein
MVDRDLVIIRPRAEWANYQLAVLFAIASVAIAIAGLRDGIPGAVLAASIAALGQTINTTFYSHWMRRRSPRALVAHRDFLAMLDASGERRYVPWTAIRAATHATTLGGMRWRLAIGDRPLILRDIGIAPERWGVLWRCIWQEVAACDRPVRVDTISNALFDNVGR